MSCRLYSIFWPGLTKDQLQDSIQSLSKTQNVESVHMKKQIDSPYRLSRREFVQIAAATTSVAAFQTPMWADSSAGEEHVVFQQDTVPVLRQCDAAVVGGGFAGIAAAIAMAKAGKKVVLVERRIYLGREVTSEYRPWFEVGSDAGNLPEFMQACMEPNLKQPTETRRLVRFDHVKRTLEDTLFEHDVDIVYASNVVQVLADGEELQGIVIGNKSGRQAILSKLVLDCTETASVVHLTGQEFADCSGSAEYSRMLEYTHIARLSSETIDVPPELGIHGNRVMVQPGYRGKGHYYVDCPMVFTDPAFDVRSVTDRETHAWEKSLAVASYLYQRMPEFKEAYLTNSSYQLKGRYSPRMRKRHYVRERSISAHRSPFVRGMLPWNALPPAMPICSA